VYYDIRSPANKRHCKPLANENKFFELSFAKPGLKNTPFDTEAKGNGLQFDSGASAREARQRSTMGKKNW